MFRSTFPLIPGTVPVLEYCNSIAYCTVTWAKP